MSLCRIHSDHISCSKYIFKKLKIKSPVIAHTPLGVSTTEQLLEVLGDKNEEKVEPTLVVGRVRLDKADNNDKAVNARLNITSSCARDGPGQGADRCAQSAHRHR